ncbi:hypothetical protein ACP90_12980 [Labrenzia sp. CP4]|nr:hypothetical protein [Labrenzia sp. CP4]AMN53205.1 hypothetical protein ACP90_12980 [Labrenzia sp. CP4]
MLAFYQFQLPIGFRNVARVKRLVENIGHALLDDLTLLVFWVEGLAFKKLANFRLAIKAPRSIALQRFF